MCCDADHWDKADLLAWFGKRKTMLLWKTLTRGGVSGIANYRYSPGVHTCKVKKYDPINPTGFHVQTRIPCANRDYDRRILVTVYRDSLVRAGDNQAVFSKISISKAEWKRVFGKRRPK